jgi:glycosyltransferase involved in cell wall biosynthesis
MATKLRIGIIGTRGIPNRYGGFEAFAEQVSVRLAARGHHVAVYCSHDQHYRATTLNGVHLIHCYNPEKMLGTAGQFIYDLNCNLHSRKQSFDVILHLGYTSDSVWSWRWHRKAKHVTNMDGMEWKRSKYTPAVRFFLKQAERWAATRSDLLIADSEVIREYLEAKYPTPVSYISYGADVPSEFDPAVPAEFHVQCNRYDLLIARMEPENSVEMAILAKLRENGSVPLLIFSNQTSYGNTQKNRFQHEPMIRFQGANYDQNTLNSLRHFARYYIHGHSAGGTNPSLLEAMACQCRILAHENPYNRSVLKNNAEFFKDPVRLAALLLQELPDGVIKGRIENNLTTIRTHHDWEHITNEYENALSQTARS